MRDLEPCERHKVLSSMDGNGTLSVSTCAKFGFGVQNEAGQSLTEFYQENALVIANTLFQQHKRQLYTWTSPDGQYQNQTDYILCDQRWRSSLCGQQKQDLELTVAQIMNFLLPNSDLN